MGNLKIILAIILGIFLVGCSKSVEEDLPKEPIEETSIEFGNPPEFAIVSGNHGTSGTLDKYCWEVNGKTCALEATPPNERLQGIHPIRLNQEEKVNFFIFHTIST